MYMTTENVVSIFIYTMIFFSLTHFSEETLYF